MEKQGLTPASKSKRAASGRKRTPSELEAAAGVKPDAKKTASTGAKGQKSSRKSPPKPQTLNKEQAREIFSRFAASDPAPKTELEHVSPYTLLVAVVLSAQATDAGVNKATRGLFAQADTPQKMVELGEDKVRDAIKTIGLFNTKAKNVVALSKALVDAYGGVVPQDRAALETLPGVGRKSANVVLNVCFDQPTIAVDTHIFRVANRTGLAPGKTPLEVELGLEAISPLDYTPNVHHWLILHGRYVCKARKPECWRCLIADICLFEPKTPEPKTKPPHLKQTDATEPA